MSQTPTPPQASAARSQLLDVLRKNNLLNEEQIAAIELRSHGDVRQIESLLVREGHLTLQQLNQLKAQLYGWIFMDFSKETLQKDALRILPRTFAAANHILAFKKGSGVAVVMADPNQKRILRLLRKKFGTVDAYFTDEKTINDSMRLYEQNSYTQQVGTILESRTQPKKVAKGQDDVSIMQLVDAILLHGCTTRASDIHIEPRVSNCIVRERVDGLLRQVLEYPKNLHPSVALRLKVMANLATDEHGAPQDGKLVYHDPEGKRIDVRVSILPITQGEKMVLRLLMSEDEALPIEQIGLQKSDEQIMEHEISRSPWGMILVTGPTGSGKTSTLYAIVNRLNKEHVNISTIEDPVEYELAGINQIQVNEKAGLTFADGLRSILRQDPNIVLVGEIRDGETANIGISAAMTGHLVLSTLHTNDAPTAIPRLIDMGIEPFLISSTVNLIVAQRLVRKICTRCRQSTEVSYDVLSESLPLDVAAKLLAQKRSTYRFYQGKGCDLCGGTGYKGRMGIFELLRVNEKIRSKIIGRANADDIRKVAVESGMSTMLDDGLQKALQGLTTFEEILRVIRS